MAINLISPGIRITETDQVASVQAAGVTTGGFAGMFNWGPVEQAVLVTSESELVQAFGAPNATNAVDFLTAANFLSYGASLQVVRAANTAASAALNATAEATTGSGTAGTGLLVKNDAAYETYVGGSGNVGPWIAKHPGALGNSIKVSTCPSSSAWQSTLSGTYTVAIGSTTVVGDGSAAANTELIVGDLVIIEGRTHKVSAITNTTHFTISSAHLTGASGATVTRRWEFFGNFDQAPGTSTFASGKGGSGDEMHVAVVDEDGLITGTPGTLLEKFQAVSKGSDAKDVNGGTNYYKTKINDASAYIRWMDHDAAGSNWGNAVASTTFTAVTVVLNYSLAGGADGGVPTAGNKITALGLFENKANLSISVMPMGSATASVINYAIGVAEDRKDFVVCFSPESGDVVNQAGSEASNIVGFADTITASTYGIMDGNWKYQYNKYLDSFVYVPCNGDVAGLLARTDRDRAPWFSPAGYTNGNILNAVKLAWNPNEASRDILYKRSVNPIFTQPGRGTVLFGDKTFTTTGSSFNRINVRRLFIAIRGAIGSFAENVLFEQNDAATRASFVDAVEPYLRSVVGGRGITEFAIVCDETNNPAGVVDANEFVADIYVRPIASINFIQLNFVSVRGSSSIAEV